MKTVGGLRKTRHCGRDLVEWFFVLTAAAYNLIRIPKILGRHTISLSGVSNMKHSHKYCRLAGSQFGYTCTSIKSAPKFAFSAS